MKKNKKPKKEEKRMCFISKTRWGTYELLTGEQYLIKLMYG